MQARIWISCLAAATMLAGCHRVRAPEQAGVFEPSPTVTTRERVTASPVSMPPRIYGSTGIVWQDPLPPSQPPPPPQLERVLVILRTLENAKSAEDQVWVTLRHGQEVLAERLTGSGQPWGSGTERELELWLSESLPLTSIDELKLEISKVSPEGAEPLPWSFRAEMLGRTRDGTVVMLLEPTGQINIEEGRTRVELPIPLRN
jgi:hypothetical protein